MLQAAFAEHEAKVGGLSVGIVVGALVVVEVESPQQSSSIPSAVGQQSPVRPRLAQPGLEEH